MPAADSKRCGVRSTAARLPARLRRPLGLEAGLERHRAAFGESAAYHMRRVLGADVGVQRQRCLRCERVALFRKGLVLRLCPGQRIERQSIAHRRVARDQVTCARRAGTTGCWPTAPRRRLAALRAGSAAHSRSDSQSLLECTRAAARARVRRRVASRRDRRSRAGAARARGSTRRPRSRAGRSFASIPRRCVSRRMKRSASAVVYDDGDALVREESPHRSSTARHPCARCAESAQRGSCSPGYHLPCPKCRKPPAP